MERGGFLMIEVILSIAISSVLLLAFSTLVLQSNKVSRSNVNEFKASMYLREAIEASRDLEQSNWAEIEKGACQSPGLCHPEISGGAWIFSGGEEVLEGSFTRSLTVFPVSRDTLVFPNEIVSAGGVDDPNTKRMVVTVGWDENGSSRVLNLETYAYRIE